MKPLRIDGSAGEGGGQIFRLSLALSALTGRDVHLTHIRAGRPKPGLARQHLTAAEALTHLCRAEAEGLELGSTTVRFRPGGFLGGRLHVDVGTAGSVTLVLQAVLIPALFGLRATALTIRGGTDVPWSPPADYTRMVFLPLLAGMRGRASLQVERRGYYPAGGGQVRASIEPTRSLTPFRGESMGSLQQIAGKAHASNLPAHVAERMKSRGEEALADFQPVAVEAVTYGGQEAKGRGGAFVLCAQTTSSRIGASAIAAKGVPAERIADRAAEELRKDLRAKVTLDRYAADQLLPYMALASEPSVFWVREVSGHLRTLFWLLPQFLEVRFQTQEEGDRTRVTVIPSRTWRSDATPPAEGPPPGPAG
ncbi:MAG: RNA 3'-terminal phosphate cyclase [Thermoplasmata archaeon]|nr:RNA 3'-terminal phosphate cyclase [Thermoplasmata archaeon]